ncbi:hypothetical protein PV04_06145 [Phialophora macrospora]|uniref:DUF7918 domain-containing protein n=1 Tax=Phialophora macrospora TaxID=1851006 RepID=A0A0D2FFL8_9EURO|nr:hypothetical protein PV04_06145 [Phialophora macrospora]
MTILGKFEVQVFIDGIRAEEFDDDEEEQCGLPRVNEVTKYIEAVSGAYFEFRFFAEANYEFSNENAISFTLFVDGKRIIGKYVQEEGFRTARIMGTRVEGRCEGRRSMESTGLKLYKFQFADLTTRDLELNDDVSTFKKMYGDLGTLKVEVWRIKLLDSLGADNYSGKEPESVPEKALKGRPLDLATRMIPVAVTDQRRDCRKSEAVGEQPLATFKFKYRTRRALQSLLILDRSPTPVPLEDRPVEKLTREEALELLRRQREQRDVKQESGTKRERNETATETKPRRPLKTSKGNSGETIYHIDSDDEDDKDAIEELPSGLKPAKVKIVELLDDD